MSTRFVAAVAALTLLAAVCLAVNEPPGNGNSKAAADVAPSPGALWDLANSRREIHRFSTLFTAQQVKEHLATDAGIDAAIRWCKWTGITRVYLESFRNGYQAKRETLVHARKRFQDAGMDVSGCVTTTEIGKRSNGWTGIGCYTDQATQERLQAIFEFTAALFDEIMIDDFWFTDCTCTACEAARQARTVTVGKHTYPVRGDTWEDYRCELMVRLSRERILQAARRVNPKVKIIIKFPQWYDRFHERGYEVLRETEDFDRIWVGTETRDYRDKRWGGTPQYEGYFLMRWLGGLGGTKCGGGWYDPYGTTAKTYVEQARQTVLAGARESVLFCYGDLQRGTGPKNVEALRAAIPELLAVAQEVGRRKAIGIAAYRPANSHPEKEARVFDFVGMMGLPLLPCHEFPTGARAAFFSVHALKDPHLIEKLSSMIRSGTPVLLTDGLAKKLSGKVKLDVPGVHILAVKGDPKSLLELGQAELDAIRAPLMRPLGRRLESPNRVAIYLFADGSEVIENFNDHAVTVRLDSRPHEIAPRGWVHRWNPLFTKDVPAAAGETVRAGPYSLGIDGKGVLGDFQGPKGQTIRSKGGVAGVRYGTKSHFLGQPSAIVRSPDGIKVEYLLPDEPGLHICIDYRLRAESKAAVLTREVAIRADSRLREDLTITFPQWPGRLPVDTWLPLFHGTGGQLGARPGGYALQGPLPPDCQRLALPMATYRLEDAATRVTVATDPYFSTVLTANGVQWTFPKKIGLEEAVEKRRLVTMLHEGTPDDALAAFFQHVLPEVPPGPDWLHEIAMVNFDYMSDGGKGWFNDIDALAVAIPRNQRGKVFLCLHGWYDWLGRYSFDAKTGDFDKQWTAFGNAARYRNRHKTLNIGGEEVDGGFDKCSPVTLTCKQLHRRLEYAKSRGFRVGLYFADGLNAGTALPGFSKRLVLKTGGWVGPDTSGDTYCMNPSVPEVREFFLRYTDALLRQYGDVVDALVWDETFTVAADTYGSAEVPGYSSRAMMRLVRQIAHKAEMHTPSVALLTSDCAGVLGTANYALVAHGTYQDSWCQPGAWSYAIFPNWRNTAWSCCWWPIHKWKWIEFGVRNYQAPVAISNGWGDNTGFAEMSPELRKRVMDLFQWRAEYATRMKWMRQLPVFSNSTPTKTH